jgi:hypothetical protein
LGSLSNQALEKKFNSRTNDVVYLGVGSFGNDATRAGKCYRITADGVVRDLIVQVINQGGDVPNGNFDLLMGDGGFGIYNACSDDSTSVSQFDGPGSLWGVTYGGWDVRAGCDKLPKYPHCGNSPQDNMQELCRWSFDNNFRTNPKITKMCEVLCPVELYSATGLQRSDPTNNLFTCGATGISGLGLLTRTMDCTKPSYGWNGNVKGPTIPGFELVVPCRRDGYTRINV